MASKWVPEAGGANQPLVGLLGMGSGDFFCPPPRFHVITYAVFNRKIEQLHTNMSGHTGLTPLECAVIT